MNDLTNSSAVPAQDCWASKAKQLPGATPKTSYVGQVSRAATSRGELIAKVGTVVSAIMASSCCWLPVLLLAVGVSGAGIATALEAYRPIFMVVTFAFLAMAFYFTYRPRPVMAESGDCCSPQSAPVARRRFNMMSVNKGMLWVVTALAVVFLFFPQAITGLIGNGNDAITRDMTRSMVIIEGMTCEGWRVKAVQAIRQAPGVLAVQVDYKSGQATIGTERDRPVPRDAILQSLQSIGYSGQFIE